MRLFTDRSMIELYEENKDFFAESSPLVGESELVVIIVKDSVKLDIQYEKDGVKVYKVKPEYVIGLEGVNGVV